jgi:acyl carrier protein
MAAEEATIRDVLRKHGYDVAEDVDASLGPGGLALDSIAIVEVLLDIEERLGVAIVEELLKDGPFTISGIAAYARARRSA